VAVKKLARQVGVKACAQGGGGGAGGIGSDKSDAEREEISNGRKAEFKHLILAYRLRSKSARVSKY